MGSNQTNRYLLNSLLFILAVLPLTGCREGTGATKQVAAELERAIEHAQTQLERIKPQALEVPALAGEQLEKLYAIEYRVVSLGLTESSAELEKRLTALGKERWECQLAPQSAEGPRLVCRRLPLSYLKLLAQVAGMM
jgi:hypothetical protein